MNFLNNSLLTAIPTRTQSSLPDNSQFAVKGAACIIFRTFLRCAISRAAVGSVDTFNRRVFRAVARESFIIRSRLRACISSRPREY